MLARKYVKNARTLVAKNVLKFADNVLTLAVKLAVVNELKFPSVGVFDIPHLLTLILGLFIMNMF